MLKNESNQLVAITNIRESLNTQHVTWQQSAQTGASVSNNIPLGSMHVTTKVIKPFISYSFSKINIKKWCIGYFRLFFKMKISILIAICN